MKKIKILFHSIVRKPLYYKYMYIFLYMAFLAFNQKTKPEVTSCFKKISKQFPNFQLLEAIMN